jgi:hypothetical protein
MAPPLRSIWGTPGTACRPATGCGCRSPPATTPLYVAHPGTAESPWFATSTAVNHQRLLTGGTTPSHLSLTVLDE